LALAFPLLPTALERQVKMSAKTKKKNSSKTDVTVKTPTLSLIADLKSPGLEIKEPIFHADKITTSKGPVQSTEVRERHYKTNDIQYVRKDQRQGPSISSITQQVRDLTQQQSKKYQQESTEIQKLRNKTVRLIGQLYRSAEIKEYCKQLAKKLLNDPNFEQRWWFRERPKRKLQLPEEIEQVHIFLPYYHDHFSNIEILNFDIRKRFIVNGYFLHDSDFLRGDLQSFIDQTEKNLIAEGILSFPATQDDSVDKPEGTKPIKHNPPEGEWSNAMPMSEMMQRVSIHGYKKFKTFAKPHGLKQLNRQLWQIRLDGMDKTTRARLEKN